MLGSKSTEIQVSHVGTEHAEHIQIIITSDKEADSVILTQYQCMPTGIPYGSE